MQTENWFDEIRALPVWDTHTHLDVSESASARSFWDIAHYFWFKRELDAVGYPANPGELNERERAAAFLKAFDRARNTYWSQSVRRGVRELWDATLDSVDAVLDLDRRVRATALRPDWVGEVLGRVGVQRIVIGDEPGPAAGQLGARAFVLPVIYRFPPQDRIAAILEKTDQKHAVEALAGEVEKRVNDLAAAGYRTIRAPFSFVREELRPADIPMIDNYGNTERAIRQYLSHVLYHALDRHGFHVQIFVGMERKNSGHSSRGRSLPDYAQNDPRRIADMHEIFDMYSGCTFEILNAAEHSALDIVQAARIFPNVYPGGLWWFNFRASTYRANMQYRIEALPACRSSLIASDARCVEWCYIKVSLVKRLLAEFLSRQVADGWLDRDAALYTARCWLHDSAAAMYRSVPASV